MGCGGGGGGNLKRVSNWSLVRSASRALQSGNTAAAGVRWRFVETCRSDQLPTRWLADGGDQRDASTCSLFLFFLSLSLTPSVFPITEPRFHPEWRITQMIRNECNMKPSCGRLIEIQIIGWFPPFPPVKVKSCFPLALGQTRFCSDCDRAPAWTRSTHTRLENITTTSWHQEKALLCLLDSSEQREETLRRRSVSNCFTRQGRGLKSYSLLCAHAWPDDTSLTSQTWTPRIDLVLPPAWPTPLSRFRTPSFKRLLRTCHIKFYCHELSLVFEESH